MLVNPRILQKWGNRMKKATNLGKSSFAQGAKFLALAMALLMMLTLPGFALQEGIKTTPSLTYEVWDGNRVILSTGSTYIRSDWDASGCPLHGKFDYDCTMRRLRLVFYEAYNLPATAQALRSFNSYEDVMNSSYIGGRTLRSQLTDYAAENCRGADGIETLQKLKQFPEYKYYTETQQTVDGILVEINYGARAENVRRSLAYFFPRTMLDSMTVPKLLELATIVMDTPEYIAFHNCLYGHYCSTVNNLLRQGYSIDQIAEAYTQQARLSVSRIWPDYQTRLENFRNSTHAW